MACPVKRQTWPLLPGAQPRWFAPRFTRLEFGLYSGSSDGFELCDWLSNMRFYIALAALFLLGSAALLAVFGPDGRTWLEIGLIAGGLLPVVVQQTPRLYLSYTKLKFHIRNSPTTWDLSFRFRPAASSVDLSAIGQQLLQAFPGGAIIASTTNRLVVRVLRRYVLELALVPPGLEHPEEMQQLELEATIAPVTVGYRDSKRLLDRELLPLLNRLQSLAASTWSCYTLRVDLPDNNPFFGVYLHQLNLSSIENFNIVFQVPFHDTQNRVLVAKERLTIVSESLDAFRLAILAALAFKVPEPI